MMIIWSALLCLSLLCLFDIALAKHRLSPSHEWSRNIFNTHSRSAANKTGALSGLFVGGGGGAGHLFLRSCRAEALEENTIPVAASNHSLFHTLFHRGNAKLWCQTQFAKNAQHWHALAPKIAQQAKLVESSVPLVSNRVMQYVNPTNVLALTATSHPLGVKLLRKGMWASVALGGAQLLHDALRSRLAWSKAVPREDSYAVVTGASSELGKAMAKNLYHKGYNLLLIARNATKLQSVRDEIVTSGAEHSSSVLPSSKSEGVNISPRRNSPEVQLISCDLSDPSSSFHVLNELKRKNLQNNIDVLICNTARPLSGQMESNSLVELRNTIDLNIAANVQLIRTLLPRMIFRRSRNENCGSRIVIVGSTAGALPGPSVAVYTATKAFLSSFAKSLNRELLPKGIAVSLANLNPFADKNIVQSGTNQCRTKIACSITNWFEQPVDEVASSIIEGMKSGQDVITPGKLNSFCLNVLAKIVPTPMLASFVKCAWEPSVSASNRCKFVDEVTKSTIHSKGVTKVLGSVKDSFAKSFLFPARLISSDRQQPGMNDIKLIESDVVLDEQEENEEKAYSKEFPKRSAPDEPPREAPLSIVINDMDSSYSEDVPITVVESIDIEDEIE